MKKKNDTAGTNKTELRIAVITSLQGGVIGQGQIKMLRRFPDVLGEHANEIFIISGWRLIDAKNMPSKTGGNKSSMFITSLKYIPSGEIGTSVRLAQILSKVDVIIFFLSAPLILPTLLTKLARRKTIFMLTGLGSKEVELKVHYGLPRRVLTQTYKLLETICFNLVDQIVAESENILHFHGLDRYAPKFTVFGADYIDTSIFKIDRPLSKRQNIIGYIGRFSSEKGTINFVQALSIVFESRSDFAATIAGDGLIRNEIEDEIRKRKLEGKVTLTGWIPHQEIPRHLNQLKLVVSPTSTEGLPPIIQEAMACGTPVLATPVGGIPDLLVDSDTGFIMENNSPECIADNIFRALDHPNLEKISRNAQAIIEREYTRDVLAAKYGHVLTNLLESDKG